MHETECLATSGVYRIVPARKEGAASVQESTVRFTQRRIGTLRICFLCVPFFDYSLVGACVSDIEKIGL
jgi:hypothetical protein